MDGYTTSLARARVCTKATHDEDRDRSCKQPFADKTTASRPGRTSEDGTRGVQCVAVKRIGGCQTALERDELAPGIALKADEEESGIDLARVGFGRLGVGIATTQDALPIVVAWVG